MAVLRIASVVGMRSRRVPIARLTTQEQESTEKRPVWQEPGTSAASRGGPHGTKALALRGPMAYAQRRTFAKMG